MFEAPLKQFRARGRRVAEFRGFTKEFGKLILECGQELATVKRQAGIVDNEGRQQNSVNEMTAFRMSLDPAVLDGVDQRLR